jgi:hypothetical protein
MTFGRYVLTSDVTVPAGVSSFPAAGPATTATGATTAAPASGVLIGSGVALSPGTYLLSWTVTLQTAAAAGDAGNFSLTAGSTAVASVNPGAVGSYPQAAVTYYAGSGTTAVVKVGGSAGSAGSVYAASLTVTPLLTGDAKGALAWTGPGSPAEWTAGPFPVTYQAGTPLWLDTTGPLYAALGSANLRAWIDGTDSQPHGRWGALSN